MKKSLAVLVPLIAVSLPAPSALGAPSIEFLNPSAYSTPPPTISDVTDRDGFVHLVAWAQEPPASSLVEFEIEATGENPSTFTADRVTDDTWEAFAPLPDSYTDGPSYTLRARLYSGVPGNADEVDNAEMTVEVDQSEVPPPPGDAVEMSHPDNGGVLGFFRPAGKRPNALVTYQASVDTGQVRALYTLSQPGEAPVWETCGRSVPSDEGSGTVRCTLGEGHAPEDVRAVAAVSNKTSPPSAPNPELDSSGDAHRVSPYLQEATNVQLLMGDQPSAGTCSFLRATVTDQFGRPMAGANVDVHAQGPTDGLRFASSAGQTSPFRAPNTGHGSREDAKRCSDNSNVGKQGDHNSRAGADAKHIESAKGTTNGGEFLYGLRSPAVGDTQVRVWVDLNNDDEFDGADISRRGKLTWIN